MRSRTPGESTAAARTAPGTPPRTAARPAQGTAPRTAARPAPGRTPRTAARTLWEEGRRPGGLVVLVSAFAVTLATLVSLALGDQVGVFFDVVLVAVCAAAALAVRPRDFFTVGVLPPLLLGATVLVLALTNRGAVARPEDKLLQALVSGLAHHAVALTVGYGLTLLLLALRQVALRHHGTLRPRRTVPVRREPSPEPGSPAGAPAEARR